MTDKQRKRWFEEIDKFKNKTDKLGMTIEGGILETVVALNMAGIKTSQSCEGHLDRGLAGPWVQITGSTNDDSRNLNQMMLDEYKKADLVKAQNPESFLKDSEYASYMEKFRELQNLLLVESQKNAEKLIVLLGKFYMNREIDFDCMLIVNGVDSVAPTLISQGSYLQNIRNAEEKEKNIQRYRKEMKEFADFLVI